ncbi:MAG: DUF4935 domain-containing protein [Ignavibacteriales bacterium]|nr:DUF4935 domain-containing protein [Ignavibacteriales bacterium]
MDVILDTNILRKDFKMTSKLFEAFLVFLKKTDSRLVLPEIVVDEILSLYKRELDALNKKYSDVVNKISNTSFITAPKQNLKIDLEKEVTEFNKLILHPPNIYPTVIIPNKSEHLKESINILLSAQKPASEKRNEYRDVLIWLSIKEHLKKRKKLNTSFISANTKEFSDENNQLAPTLIEEVNKLGSCLNYYPSLEEFLKCNADKIEFIDEQWINNNLDSKEVIRLLSDTLERRDYKITQYLERREDNITGEIDINEIDYSVDDYFVIDIDEENIFLHLNLFCTVEVEYYIKEYYDLLYGEYEKERHRKQIEFLADFSVEIVDKEIVGIELDDWDFA